jgi:hypothetical protein
LPLLVLDGPEQVKAVLYHFHDLMSHPGEKVVRRWVMPRFWYPSLGKIIHKYCKSCDICQKYQQKLPEYKFIGISSISGLFYEFQVDFLGPLPEGTNNTKYVLVAVEKLSRYPIALPVETTTAKIAIEFITSEIIARFGVPQVLTVDRGKCFVAEAFQNFIQKCGKLANLLRSNSLIITYEKVSSYGIFSFLYIIWI